MKREIYCIICGIKYIKNESKTEIGRSKTCSINCRRKYVASLMVGNKYNLGKKHTEERKKQISEQHKGNKYALGHKLSVEHKAKLIASTSGANNWNWRNGVYPEVMAIRRSFHMRQWSKNIMERDNYTCQHCGHRNKKGLGYSLRFVAHHIKSFKEYPALMFELNNGITLCVPCHIQYHKDKNMLNKWHREIKWMPNKNYTVTLGVA